MFWPPSSVPMTRMGACPTTVSPWSAALDELERLADPGRPDRRRAPARERRPALAATPASARPGCWPSCAPRAERRRLAGRRSGTASTSATARCPTCRSARLFGRLDAEAPGLVRSLVEASPASPRADARPPGARRAGRADPMHQRSTAAELFEAVHAALERLGPRPAAAAGRRGRALGRPVDPRPAQLPVLPPASTHRSRSSRPTAATTCTGGTRCAPPLREWARLPGRHPARPRPLPDADVRALVGVLHPAPLRESDVRGIVERAEGNAFFTEELVAAAASRRRRAAARPRRPAAGAPRPARRRRPPGGPGCRRSPGAACPTELLERGRRRPGRPRAGAARRRRAQRAGAGRAATATRSGTRCSPRRSTTTCCRASGCGCTRPTSQALRSGDVGGRRPSWPGTPAPPTTSTTAVPGEHRGRRRGDGGRRPRRGGAPLRAGPRAAAGPDVRTAWSDDRRRRADRQGQRGGDRGRPDLTGPLALVQDQLAPAVPPTPRRRRGCGCCTPRSRSRSLADDRGRPAGGHHRGAGAGARRAADSRCAPRCSRCTRGPSPTGTATRRRPAGRRRRSSWPTGSASPTCVADATHHAGPARSERRRRPRGVAGDAGGGVAEARAAGDVAAELRGLYNLGTLHYEAAELDEALGGLPPRRQQRASETGRPWAPYGAGRPGARPSGGVRAGDWDGAARARRRVGAVAAGHRRGDAGRPPAWRCAAGRGDAAAVDLLPGLRPLVGARRAWSRSSPAVAAIDLHGDAGDLDGGRSRPTTTGRDRRRHVAEPRLPGPDPAERAAARAAGRRGGPRSAADERADLARRGGRPGRAARRAGQLPSRRRGARGPRARPGWPGCEAEHARLRWLTGVDPPRRGRAGRRLGARRWRRSRRSAHVFEHARSQARLAAVLRAAGRRRPRPRELADAAPRHRAPARRRAAAAPSCAPSARPAGAARGDPARRARSRRASRRCWRWSPQGRSNREIAGQLFISAQDGQRARVQHPGQARRAGGRTEAVAVARRRGYLGRLSCFCQASPGAGAPCR